MQPIYLVLTPFFPTENNFRGPFIFDQVKAIKRNSNYDVKVIKFISFFHKNNVEEYTYQGVKVYNFKIFDIPSFVLPGLFNFINLKRLERLVRDIMNIDLTEVEIIHSHSAYPAGALAVELGQKFDIKSFVQHHGFDVMLLNNSRIFKGKLKKFHNQYIKNRFLQTVNNTDLNIGVSQKIIDTLHTENKFINKNTLVLFNGVNTRNFYQLPNIKKSNSFTIGCIANFSQLKDHITLLKAINIVVKNTKNLTVKFIGTGPTLDQCKEYIKINHLKEFVEFKDEVNHLELNNFYNGLDLFVLPSYSEGFGCVYAEALHIGIPIIAVRGQGIEEVLSLTDRRRLLINKGDYKDLAQKIKSQIKEPLKIDYNFDIDRWIVDFLNKIKNK